MSKINFEFSVGSDLDYNDLVADIGYDTKLVALLTQEEGLDNMRIQLYPPISGEYWNFPLNEFVEVLQQAKKRLGELRKNQEDEDEDRGRA